MRNGQEEKNKASIIKQKYKREVQQGGGGKDGGKKEREREKKKVKKREGTGRDNIEVTQINSLYSRIMI